MIFEPPPTLILLSHHFTSASKPGAKKSWLLSQSLPHLVGHRLRLANVLERISRPSFKPFYATNTSHRKQETFVYECPLHWVLLPINTHKIMLLLVSTFPKHGRHFDYWNQLLNMRMRVCYLDCHEAGLCCYVVIHLENLLHPLQMFYFHLWTIYWFSLVKLSIEFRLYPPGLWHRRVF
jgi:hypothetical protein